MPPRPPFDIGGDIGKVVDWLIGKQVDGDSALNTRLSAVENPPRFRAYRNAALSGASGSAVVYDTVEADSHSWFNTTTGLYVPQRAGTYRFSWNTRPNAALTADAFFAAYLTKNGSLIRGGQIGFQRGTVVLNSAGSAQMNANGTTDSFGVIFQHSNGGSIAIQVGLASIFFNFFDGEWVCA